MRNFFTEHPNSIGETYSEHFRFAIRNGFSLFIGGIACIIHAVFPFVFTTIASRTVYAINKNLTQRQNRQMKQEINDELKG